MSKKTTRWFTGRRCTNAYRPSEVARASLDEFEESGLSLAPVRRIMTDEIVEGTDELGVLLMGHPLRAWWYGSELSVEESRKLVAGQNATTVQVAAGLSVRPSVDVEESRVGSCWSPTTFPGKRSSRRPDPSWAR